MTLVKSLQDLTMRQNEIMFKKLKKLDFNPF